MEKRKMMGGTQRGPLLSTFKNFIITYLPFVLVAVVGLVYHIRIRPMAGDDVFYRQAADGRPHLDYLTERYETWTSRFVIEAVLVIIVKYPLLWKILDFLVFATFPLLLSGIFGGGRLINWCAAGAVLLYPFHDMGSAGWITTTINYFWPLWGMFFVGMLIRKMVMREKIHPVESVCGILVCLLASSHEQVAVILFVVFVLYLFYLWQERRRADDFLKGDFLEHVVVSGDRKEKGKKVHKRKERQSGLANRSMGTFLGLAAVNVLTLISILLCPGNAARNAVSIADLPVFESYHFGDKLYLGLLSIERVFLANADMVFFTVALIFAALVYWKTDDYKKTLISAIPLLILFGQTVVRTAYPGLSGVFVTPGQITEWSWGELSTWIPMVYLGLTVASMLLALYWLLGEQTIAYVYALLMLGCGFGAGMVLGFMATIYVSGERVYITLYFILLFVTMLCIDRMKEQIGEKLGQTGGKLAVTLLALVCLVNIGFVALSCG